MTAVETLPLVFVLVTCMSCSKRVPGVGSESSGGGVRVGTARASPALPESRTRESNACRISVPESLLFSDCVDNEGKATLGKECYTYRLRDADGRDGKVPCLPGVLALDIDGPGSYTRGALVRAEFPGDGPNARVRLRVERITLWEDGRVRVGDTIGHLVTVDSRIAALELSTTFPPEIKRRRVELVQGSRVSSRSGACVFTYQATPSFTECVTPPQTHSSVPDCYEYSIVPVDRDTGEGICVPGEARFRVVGAIGYFREAIVDTEVVYDARGTADGALLRVREISAWPGHELQVGDIVGTLRSPNGKPIVLELDRDLRSKTGAKVLKISD